MKQLFLYLFLFFLPAISHAQTFQVGHLQQTFTDASRSNRSIPCEIYYPATSAGNNTPVAVGKFPVLVFGHGFVMTWSAYDIYWQNIVPEGYIMVFPTTETSFSPSHTDMGKDLAFMCKALAAEGNNASSVFYQAVDTTCAVMGHSMGGGCAFLAMQYDSSITAFASFAAAVTNPSSVQAATLIRKPGIVFSGANDCVAPAANHQRPMYDSLASASKTFISIIGGDHCQFGSSNFNCTLGQSFCSPQATINAAAQQGVVFKYLLPWLNFYLKKDCQAGNTFQGFIGTDTQISAEQKGTLECNASSIKDLDAESQPGLFPNPAQERVYLRWAEDLAGRRYSIRNAYGAICRQGRVGASSEGIDISALPVGVYFFFVDGGVGRQLLMVNR